MLPLFLHRFLAALVLPLGASLLMLVAALRWRRLPLIALPLAILWIFSTPVVADRLLRSLEDRYPNHANTDRTKSDAVFALGGGILGARDRADGDAQWGVSAERFERALKLYNSGLASFLVLSAGVPRDHNEPGEGARLREVALSRGIPAQSIILTHETRNTAAEADALAELAVRLHWTRILLVTSAFHMPRAMLLFRECPVEVIPVPVSFQTSHLLTRSNDAGIDYYFPQGEGLARSELALREYLGIVLYSVTRHQQVPLGHAR